MCVCVLAQENRERKKKQFREKTLMAVSQTGVRGRNCLAACREFKGAFRLGKKTETNWNTDAAVKANTLAKSITQNAL